MTLLGKTIVEFEGLHFLGLGGSPPGLFSDSIAFAGHPFITLDDCEAAMTEYVEKLLVTPNTILITHVPPYDLGQIINKGQIAQSGSPKLQEIIRNHSENIICFINGHIHRQHYLADFYGTHAINPGSSFSQNYAILKIGFNEKWRVTEVSLKTI